MSNARTRGPAATSPIRYIAQRPVHAQWRRVLLEQWNGVVEHCAIDPVSAHIVHIMPARSFLAAASLAATRLRFNELMAFSLRAWVQGRHQEIGSSKSDGSYQIPALPWNIGMQLDALEYPDSVMLASYDVLVSDIHKSCNSIALPEMLSAHSGSHVFRHLWASFGHAYGLDRTELSAGLGHSSPGAVTSYIHPIGSLIDPLTL